MYQWLDHKRYKESYKTYIANQPDVGLGQGLQTFYKTVSMRYLNITKVDTDAFLRSQGDYVRKFPKNQI